MTGATLTNDAVPPLAGGERRIELPSFERSARRWMPLLSRLLSLALLVAIVFALGDAGLDTIGELLPSTPLFWLALGAMYVSLPTSEWIIFRKLWRIPAAGFAALLRKRISNELLVGYSGEVYFYAWARQRSAMVAAPFGAIKDVSILSAVAGNLVTLVMLGAAYFFAGEAFTRALGLGELTQPLFLSVLILLSVPLLVFLFRQKIFALSRSELRFVLLVHLMRIAATTFLVALMWHLALPELPLIVWLGLSTLRLLVSRLPLVPNKEMLFAVVAMLIAGDSSDIGALMAMTATLVLLLHLSLGALLAITGMFEKRAEPA